MSFFERLAQRSTEAGRVKKREQRFAELSAVLLTHAEEDKAEFPEQAAAMDDCLPRFQEALRRRLESQPAAGEGGSPPPPLDAASCFCLSDDRMCALACLLPPLDGGKAADPAAFWEDLRYEGVVHGVREEPAIRQIAEGRYLHIFPVALGTPATDGVDGRVTELFAARPPLRLEAAAGTAVEFGREELIQAVQQGDAICQITSPVPGVAGLDVAGKPLPCRDGAAAAVPAGENTLLSPDGLALLAAIDGAVVSEEGLFHVRRQQIVLGNVDGVLRCPGDLYISGDVIGKADVEAGGDVLIDGQALGGQVRSLRGSIRVQGGVRGEETLLRAAQQVQTPLVESAAVQAGSDLFAEVLEDGDVTSGGGVYVLGGRGLILGGRVRADSRVEAKRIGNLSGRPTALTVGYSPELSAGLSATEEQLSQVRATLEKLRKSVGGMRAAGELLSLERRAVLGQLTEQKRLYEEQEETLGRKLKELKAALHAATSGRILCQELFPLATVRIGDREAEFQSAETGCNIHVYAGRIVVK